MFTKLFRATDAVVARFIFMAGPEEAEDVDGSSTDTDAKAAAEAELTSLITQEVTKIESQTGRKVDQKKVEAVRTIATDEGGFLEDNKLTEHEKEAVITLLRQQITEKLELKEKIQILSSVRAWEKLTVAGTTLTREGWKTLEKGTEITVKGLTPDQVKYVGLNELLPVEIDAIEANGKTYTRLAATPERRGGFYYQKEYFAIGEGTTFKIADRHGMPVAPEERAPVEDVPVEPDVEETDGPSDAALDTARTAMEVGSENSIYDRSVPIPEWLDIDNAAMTRHKWDKLLREAGQSNTNTGRVIDIIQQEPFGWNTSEFYNIIIKNGGEKLSFNDITKAKLGMSARQVERTIDDAKKSGLDRQIERTEKRIAAINDKITEITNEHTNWAKTDDETPPQWLTRIQEEIGEDDTGDAKKLSKLIEKRIKKHEELRPLTEKKDQILHMEALVAASIRLMEAMAGIEQGAEGATTTTELSETRTEGEQLAESVFTDTKTDRKAQRHDMVDVDRERTLGRLGRTDALSQRMAGDTAYDMFMQEHKLWTYEGTADGITRKPAEEAEIVAKLQEMLIAGIDLVSADPTSEIKIDAAGDRTHRLIEIADETGVEIDDAARDNLENGLTEIGKRSKDIDKTKQAIARLEGKRARRDTKDKDNANVQDKIDKKRAELKILEEGDATNEILSFQQMKENVEAAKQNIGDALKTALAKPEVIKSTLTEKGGKTEIIRELIRIGFSRDVNQLETQKYLKACEKEISKAKDPITLTVLRQILAKDTDHTHKPTDYKKWREILEKQQIPATLNVTGESDRTQRIATIGVGGTYNPNTGGFGIGGGVDVPINQNGTSIGVEGGWKEGQAGVGAHINQVFQVGERVSISATLDISALGIVGTAGISVDLGNDWQIMAAASGGTTWGIVPILSQTVGVMHGAEEAVKTAERRIDIRTGLGEIETLLQEGKENAALKKMKELPQLEKSVAQITELANGDQALIDALVLQEYEFLQQQAGIQAAKEAFIFPLSGAGVTFVESPLPLIIPWIRITIKGATRIIPVLSRSEMETKKITDDMVQQAILKDVHDASFGEIVDGVLDTTEFTIVMGPDGQHKMAIAPEKRDTLAAEFSRENVDQYNKDAHAIGLHLQPTANPEDNLYGMSFANIDNAFVEVHIDPQAQEHMSLVYGSVGSSKENIFLSFNTTRQNLIITREEIMLPYNREGKNKTVIFTIKENPRRTPAQIARAETGYLEFSRDVETKRSGKRVLTETGAVERTKAGSGKGNSIRSLDEYIRYASENKDTLEFARTQYEGAFDKTIDAFTVEAEPELDPTREKQLMDAADRYVSLSRNNKEKMRALSTIAYKFNGKEKASQEDYAALLAEVGAAAKTPFDATTLTPLEASVIVNRLMIQSFQQIHGNVDQFQNDLERFFTPMIEEIFTQKTGDEALAKKLTQEFLSRLKLNTLQFKVGDDVPAGMEVYALVGTLGYTGLRGMPNFKGNGTEKEDYQVMNMIDLDNASPELKRVVLDIVSPIPEDNEHFLGSRLGAQIGLWSPVLIGIKESEALAAHDFTSAIGVKAITQAKEIAKKIREAEVRGQTNVIINGTTVGLDVDLKGGLYERCGNPLFMGKENISVAGRAITAAEIEYVRTNPEAKAALLDFVIGYAIQPKEKIPPTDDGGGPPPPEPEDTTDGVAADETPEASVVVNPDIIVDPSNWGGNDNGAPGQGGGTGGGGRANGLPGGGTRRFPWQGPGPKK